jgi:hypothetical protein
MLINVLVQLDAEYTKTKSSINGTGTKVQPVDKK